MFKFLKDKVKGAISTITDRFEKEGEKVESPKKEIVEKPKPKKEIKKPEPKKEEKSAEYFKETALKEIKKTEEKEKIKEAKGFLAKITEKVTSRKINNSQFDEMFWELEVELLENNVAFEVITKIKDDLKDKLVDVPLKRGQIEKIIMRSLEGSVREVLNVEQVNLLDKVKEKKPFVIVFVGVNGSGKTTTIAKFAHELKEKGLSCVLAAGDTFRAASIQQLEEHGNKLGVKIIKHDYGSDPAAVGFDAVKYAKQKGIDVVLIDTAGRQHSNVNLRDEMKKIIRVVNPDLKIYIGEMIAGNDCIDQIKYFDQAIDIDGTILSKADIDEKGGTAISVSYVTGKPIYYLGMGQEYGDLQAFDPEIILKTIGFTK